MAGPARGAPTGSTQEPQDDNLGRLAAEGEYAPAQGSPEGGQHPTGEAYPAEATRFGDPEHRRAD